MALGMTDEKHRNSALEGYKGCFFLKFGIFTFSMPIIMTED